MNIQNPNELRQLLLEWHYGLLDEADAKILQELVNSDATAAAAWAETLQTVNKLSAACRADVSIPAASFGSLQNPEITNDADLPLVAKPTRSVWQTPSIVAFVAACIGWFLITLDYSENLPTRPAPAISLQATQIANREANDAQSFRVTTVKLDPNHHDFDRRQGQRSPSLPAIATSLSYSVFVKGTILYSGAGKTDLSGQAEIKLPDRLTVPPDATLRIQANANDASGSHASVEVPLEPTRCMTYLTIDRPVYRPGETVFFRSLTLTRQSFQPSVEVPIRYELLDPSGTVVPGVAIEGLTTRGVGNGSLLLPSTIPGGPYTIVAKSLDGFFPDEKRTFDVRVYRVPRFKKQIQLGARSYGPGETVTAELMAIRAEGGPVAGANVEITATVDGENVYQQSAKTSALGQCSIAFYLPDDIRDGNASLSIVVDDGGTRETISKTIPIQLGRVEVEFYPESGPLVAGLNNRVYFTARDTLGDPIAIAGEIQNRSGNKVADLNTVRDGMGRFSFQPELGERYSLKVTAPLDIQNSPELPAVVGDLPILNTNGGVFAADAPLEMTIHSNRSREVIVRAVCRGELVGSQTLKLSAGRRLIKLPVSSEAAGVIRVTVLDSSTLPATPLLERLVFRRPTKKLQIDIGDAKSTMHRSPGESMRLELQVRDEAGRPTPAILGVAVVDEASLSLDAIERPTMPTYFWLTSEIQTPADLEHANFYLSDSTEAEQAIDLLLGTQGWRRFVSGSPEMNREGQPNEAFREQLTRLLQLDGPETAGVTQAEATTPDYWDRWREYRIANLHAWQEFLVGLRVWMFWVWFAWLVTMLFRLRMRRYRHAPFSGRMAGWLLIGCSTVTLAVYGCGAPSNTAIEMDLGAESATVDETSAKRASETPPPAMESPGERRDELGSAASGQAIETLPEQVVAAIGRFTEGIMKNGQSAAVDLESMRSPITAEQLAKLLAARGVDSQGLADQIIDELRFPVRQYAHRHVPKNSDDEVRDDFTETLLWQPLIITDSNGRASVRFDLSDSVTSFEVAVDAHSASGRIGSQTAVVTSRLPFQIEPKLPLEVTTGDRIDLPIAVINATEDQQSVSLNLQADPALKPMADTARSVSLAAQQRSRETISLQVVGDRVADAVVEVRGQSGVLADAVRRSIHIVPSGYPVYESMSGKLTERTKIKMPSMPDMVPGSLAVTVRVFPSPMADVMSGVESILAEPHGCFEQASATNYPNAMALLYMKENDLVEPRFSGRAYDLLDRGYQKIIAYECSLKGYEWFGQNPGHEALSAFGLMQFTDMSRVMNVDIEMIARTRDWLLSRRDGQGGFQRNPRHLHVWSVKQEIVNAYVLWAVSEADVAAGNAGRTASELGEELDHLNNVATDSDDAYLIALAAAALMNAERIKDGERLLDKLAMLQGSDGGLRGSTTVTSSGGLSLGVETTSLAVIAWMKSGRFRRQAAAAGQWIAAHRTRGGGFGSTQGTVLALKAMLAISSATSLPADGKLQVRLAGELIGQVNLPANGSLSETAVEIKDLGSVIEDWLVQSAGDLDDMPPLQLIAEGVKDLAYCVDISSHQIKPSSSETCPLRLSTNWAESEDDASDDQRLQLTDGQTAQVQVRLENSSSSGLPMTVAIIGLPGGVEPRNEQLDELKQQGKFDYYERSAREVVLYWRDVMPNSVHEISLDVTATIPGTYTGPASRAYLYYTAEEKLWAEPLFVEVLK